MASITKLVIKKDVLNEVVEKVKAGISMSKIIRDYNLTAVSRPSMFKFIDLYLELEPILDEPVEALMKDYFPKGISVSKITALHAKIKKTGLLNDKMIGKLLKEKLDCTAAQFYTAPKIYNIAVAADILARSSTVREALETGLFPKYVNFKGNETCKKLQLHFVGCYPIGVWRK